MTDQADELREKFMQVIDYALDPDTEEGLEFLRVWREGDWDTIRNEWPDAPKADTEKLPLLIYYMRDNHTFLPLSLDVDEAEHQLRSEFKRGFTYGMLCSKYEGAPKPLHARGNSHLSAEQFFYDAKEWVTKAVEAYTCSDS